MTVKNRFHIRIVDGLLDELGYALVFIKIDLRLGYHQIRVVLEDTQPQRLLQNFKKITIVPMLSFPDFSQVFTIETDASRVAIDVILTQSSHC